MRRGKSSRFRFTLSVFLVATFSLCGLSFGPDTSRGAVLVRQDATLTATDRASGMPTTSAPGRTLQRAVIKITTYDQDTAAPSYFLDGQVELAGDPTGEPDAELNLGFGRFDGGTCVLNALLNTNTDGYSGSSYGFVGYNPDYFPTPPQPWNCLAVFLDNSFDGNPATTTYDAFVGRFSDTVKSPKLKIRRAALLGRKLGNLKLVRGVPTRIEVDFQNGGEVSTGKLTLRGSGKGLKVKRQNLGKLEAERSGSTYLSVRLAGRQKRTKLRIVVGDGASKAIKTIRVTRVRPPKRPTPGNYRDRSGRVRFTVRRGRIVGWNGTMTTRCGGYPDNFQYTTDTYSHPTTKVPRNGIVHSIDRAKLYTTFLRLRIAGGKVTSGYFSYSGPNRCFASISFNANRKGR